MKQWLNRFAPILGVALVFTIFASLTPRGFCTAGNFETMARQTTIVGLAALGMTMVIVMGGIDLSVGAVVALSTVVIAGLLQAGYPPLVAVGAGLLVGALCGMLNGLLITALRVVPFIVTLGMMLIARGVAKGLAHEQKIDVAPEKLRWLGELIATLPADRRWLLAPAGVWLTVLMAVVVAVVLVRTRFGRHTYAIGSNELTARLCGVAVTRTKVWVYALGGFFGGLAGVMQFSRLTLGDPTVAVGLELDVIAAVVIGGGSLAGGEGSVLGTVAGALIMTIVRSGCTQMDVPNWQQEILTGIIIIAAVALDRWRHRRNT